MTTSHRIEIFKLLLFFIAFLLASLAGDSCQAKPPEVMPEFTLASAMDDSVIDSRHHAGKVLLVNFWATWCSPCREEIPTLIKLRQDFSKDGFEVIGISMDEGGRALVSRFSKKMKITYPIALGTPKVARAFGGVIGIPQSFLVDRSGKIIKSYAGLIDPNVFEKDIKELLAK